MAVMVNGHGHVSKHGFSAPPAVTADALMSRETEKIFRGRALSLHRKHKTKAIPRQFYFIYAPPYIRQVLVFPFQVELVCPVCLLQKIYATKTKTYSPKILA